MHNWHYFATGCCKSDVDNDACSINRHYLCLALTFMLRLHHVAFLAKFRSSHCNVLQAAFDLGMRQSILKI